MDSLAKTEEEMTRDERLDAGNRRAAGYPWD